MSHDEKNSEASEVLVKARSIKFEPSPYMKTRILAQLRENLTEKKQRTQKFVWYRNIAILSVPVTIVLLVLTLRLAHDVHIAPAYQALAIKVDIQKADEVEIAIAEIELPEGVTFYSQAHPQINTQRTLSLDWNKMGPKISSLPFAVKANVLGEKKIKVRFFNKNKQLFQEQIIKFKFI